VLQTGKSAYAWSSALPLIFVKPAKEKLVVYDWFVILMPYQDLINKIDYFKI
jgi:hypothetical protein